MIEGRSKTKGQENKIRTEEEKEEVALQLTKKKKNSDVNLNFYSSCVQKELSNQGSGAFRELSKGCGVGTG